jgi:Mn2+/Fe2+ NRAMP family transporter
LLLAGVNWEHVFVSTIIPHFAFTPAFAMIFVTIFGATMAPYAVLLAGFRRITR